MASALDWSLDTFASISWREASVDCASKGTLASGIGVGAGVGFAGEAEACWLSVVPALETKTRTIRKTIRISGSMEERVRACLVRVSLTHTKVWFIYQGFLGNVQLTAENPFWVQTRP